MIALIGDSIGCPVDRLHLGAYSGRNLPIGLVDKKECDKECESGSERPSKCLRMPGNCATRLGSGPIQNRRTGPALEPAAAGTAVSDVSLDQERARMWQRACPIRTEEMLHVIAARDGIDS